MELGRARRRCRAHVAPAALPWPPAWQTPCPPPRVLHVSHGDQRRGLPPSLAASPAPRHPLSRPACTGMPTTQPHLGKKRRAGRAGTAASRAAAAGGVARVTPLQPDAARGTGGGGAGLAGGTERGGAKNSRPLLGGAALFAGGELGGGGTDGGTRANGEAPRQTAASSLPPQRRGHGGRGLGLRAPRRGAPPARPVVGNGAAGRRGARRGRRGRRPVALREGGPRGAGQGGQSAAPVPPRRPARRAALLPGPHLHNRCGRGDPPPAAAAGVTALQWGAPPGTSRGAPAPAAA